MRITQNRCGRVEPTAFRQDAMTTVQRLLLITLLAPALAAIQACESTTRPVVYPQRLHSPYPTGRQQVWAVAPPRNESGVSVVDELAFGDALAEEIGQVKGIDCLPLNRTLQAMRALNLPSVDTPAQARVLAGALGADALVVSTITSWYPYQPPRIGLNAGVFVRDAGGASVGESSEQVRSLSAAARASALPGRGRENSLSEPQSTVSLVLDASNTAIQAKVQEYGEARVESNDPIGWERFVKSMKLYTRFACHRAVERLLDAERDRLTAKTVTASADQAEQAR